MFGKTFPTGSAENVAYDFRVKRRVFLNVFVKSENSFLKKSPHLRFVNTN